MKSLRFGLITASIALAAICSGCPGPSTVCQKIDAAINCSKPSAQAAIDSCATAMANNCTNDEISKLNTYTDCLTAANLCGTGNLDKGASATAACRATAKSAGVSDKCTLALIIQAAQ
jgi:hypothetical protein